MFFCSLPDDAAAHTHRTGSLFESSRQYCRRSNEDNVACRSRGGSALWLARRLPRGRISRQQCVWGGEGRGSTMAVKDMVRRPADERPGELAGDWRS